MNAIINVFIRVHGKVFIKVNVRYYYLLIRF